MSSSARVVSDSTIAWLLLEAVAPALRGEQPTAVFVELGCGECHLAIERLLELVAAQRLTLPARLQSTLMTWLNSYADNSLQSRQRQIVAEIEFQ
jgi:hypothetical protein